MLRQLKPAALLLAGLSLLTGVVYPGVVTVVAQIAFRDAAGGSLLRDASGRVIGSELIGQPFDDPKYFHGRPSATSIPYDSGASSGSNLGPLAPALREAVAGRVDAARAADPSAGDAPIPVDLVTASGSGLDPHVSPAGALRQVPRVARARGLDEAAVRDLVMRHVERPTFGVLGASRVNVLRLNLALDAMH
jgi:K+-transporting ATPase ATPase C chain